MKKILKLIYWALIAISLYGFMFRTADIVAGLAPTETNQCAGNSDSKCEFNPVLEQPQYQKNDESLSQNVNQTPQTVDIAPTNVNSFQGK